MEREPAEPWHQAIAQGSPERLEMLMSGALVAPASLHAPFYLASLTHRSRELFELLGKHYRHQIHEAGPDGRTALWVTVAQGNTLATQCLLHLGADPNEPIRAGLRPWEYVLGTGLQALVAPLHLAGANWKEAPLIAWDRAWEGGHWAIVEALWDLGVRLPDNAEGRAWEAKAQQGSKPWPHLMRQLHALEKGEHLEERLPEAAATLPKGRF